MGNKFKTLQALTRVSTSTDAEPSDHKDKTPQQLAESELRNPETNVNKQKKRNKESKSKTDEYYLDDLEVEKTSDTKEMKKMRKSFKEMTQTMRNLQAFFGSNTHPPGVSLKDLLLAMGPPSSTSSKKKEEPPKELETYECCFKTKDADSFRVSIFVHGFDKSRTRDEIKSALRKYFESGGCEVERVFVPIDCQTGVPLGYAFVDVDDNEKALELRGGLVMGRRLYVLRAENQTESWEFPNFTGCSRCGVYLSKRRRVRFHQSLSNNQSLSRFKYFAIESLKNSMNREGMRELVHQKFQKFGEVIKLVYPIPEEDDANGEILAYLYAKLKDGISAEEVKIHGLEVEEAHMKTEECEKLFK